MSCRGPSAPRQEPVMRVMAVSAPSCQPWRNQGNLLGATAIFVNLRRVLNDMRTFRFRCDFDECPEQAGLGAGNTLFDQCST